MKTRNEPPIEWRHPGLLLSLLAILVVTIWPYRHFAGDDAYITFRFVRNLADGAGFSYNTGVPTYGSTAPLWVILIAGVHRLGLTVVDAAHALNWLFTILSVVLFWPLSGLFLQRPLMRWVAGLLLILNPWFVRWSLSGMENSLALSLMLAAVLVQHRMRNSGRVQWAAPLLAGLATLTRPEMLLFGSVLFADTLLFERRTRTRSLLIGAAVFAAVLAPWLWYASASFGTVVPNTITAKLSRDYPTAVVQTVKFFLSFWPLQALALVLLVALDRRRVAPVALRPWQWGRWFTLVAWGAILPAFYIAGGAPVAGRYLMFALPSYLLIGTRAWELLDGRRGRRTVTRWGLAVSFAATLALLGYVQYRYCWFVTRWTQGMDPALIDLAHRVREISQAGDVIACDQIGVIGYFSDRTVLDILGLVSPEVLPHRRPSDPNAIWRYLRERAPEFLIVVDSKPSLVERHPDYASLTTLASVNVQREGAGAVGHVMTYHLYRTNWPDSQPSRGFDGSDSGDPRGPRRADEPGRALRGSHALADHEGVRLDSCTDVSSQTPSVSPHDSFQIPVSAGP